MNDEAIKLARTFSEVLREWLSSGEMTEVVKRNKSYSPNVCASHDFCDANMAMVEAFKRCGLSDKNNRLWNEAWATAKACEFNPEELK